MCCPDVFLWSVVFVKVEFSYLFAVYVDDIIERLNDSKLGCFIGDLYLGCIMYADHLILISASVSILQQMTFICEKRAEYIDMKFNTSKSMVIRIGKRCKNICENIELVGETLDYVSKAKYLGVYIVLVKHFKLSIHESCSRFYKALNCIYSKSKGNMNEMVAFQLINAYCKPLLTYACECAKFNHNDLSQLDRAWNFVFWKAFKTYDKHCIVDIQISIRQLPISMENRRKYKKIQEK